MASLSAVWAYVQGVESFRRRAAARLSGSPVIVRATYLSGHPGIWEAEPFWVGLVADRLRLVDQRGERCYDLPVERIQGISLGEQGDLRVDFEPTAGLRTTVALRADEGAAESCRKLLEAVMLDA